MACLTARARPWLGLLFLLSTGAALLWLAAQARFADLALRQPAQEKLVAWDSAHPVTQSFGALPATTLEFYPWVSDRLALFGHSIQVNILTEDGQALALISQPAWLLNFGPGLRVDLPPAAAQNPFTIHFQTDAPPGLLGLWASAAAGLSYSGYQVGPADSPGAGNLMLAMAGLLAALWLLGAGFCQPGSREPWLDCLFAGLAVPLGALTVAGLLHIPANLPLLGSLAVCLGWSGTRLLRLWRAAGWQLRFPGINPQALLWAGLLLLAGLSRALQVGGSPVPLWVDGLNHQNLLENMLEAQNLLVDPGYPAGFHALVYSASLLSGLPLPFLLLASGQAASVLSGLGLWTLARRFLGSGQSACAALGLYWFVSPFPAYLSNWSRYPFLLGLALLPVALKEGWDLLYAPQKRPLWLALWLTLLALAHYGAFLLALAGLAALLLAWLVSRPQRLALSRRSLLLGLVGLSLPLVYLGLRAIGLLASGDWALLVEQTRQVAAGADLGYALALTFQGAGGLVWILAILGCLAAWRLNRSLLGLLAAWLALAGILTALQVILLGAAVSGLANLVYFAALPLCLPGGLVLGRAWEALAVLGKGLPRSSAGLARAGGAALLAACLAGAYQQSAGLNPRVVLVAPPDEAAYAWISANLPVDAILASNPFLWGQEYRPAGGAGWAHAMTGRRIIYPQSAADLQDLPAYLARSQAGYIYLNAGLGLLPQSAFAGYPVLYQSGGVQILKVKP